MRKEAEVVSTEVGCFSFQNLKFSELLKILKFSELSRPDLREAAESGVLPIEVGAHCSRPVLPPLPLLQPEFSARKTRHAIS